MESLQKVDKSITFHYCTVICDVLRPIEVIFLKRQHILYLIFCVSNFFKVGKFATFSKRLKSKSVSALPLDPAGGFAPDPLL